MLAEDSDCQVGAGELGHTIVHEQHDIDVTAWDRQDLVGVDANAKVAEANLGGAGDADVGDADNRDRAESAEGVLAGGTAQGNRCIGE